MDIEGYNIVAHLAGRERKHETNHREYYGLTEEEIEIQHEMCEVDSKGIGISHSRYERSRITDVYDPMGWFYIKTKDIYEMSRLDSGVLPVELD